jgi:hypothetical protein
MMSPQRSRKESECRSAFSGKHLPRGSTRAATSSHQLIHVNSLPARIDILHPRAPRQSQLSYLASAPPVSRTRVIRRQTCSTERNNLVRGRLVHELVYPRHQGALHDAREDTDSVTRFGEPRKRRVNPYVSGGDIAPGPRPIAPIMCSGIHGD